jgi:hypothetical protein
VVETPIRNSRVGGRIGDAVDMRNHEDWAIPLNDARRSLSAAEFFEEDRATDRARSIEARKRLRKKRWLARNTLESLDGEVRGKHRC